jgi:phosphatidylglycerophosphatase A
VRRVALALATCFGVGRARVAPGTLGTAVAVPLAWLMAPLSPAVYVTIVTGFVLVAMLVADVAERSLGGHDPRAIVIDEVAGYLVACTTVPRSAAGWLVAAFVLFRVLDIGKPPPICWIDEDVPGGVGIVLDDVAAGALAAVILYAAQHAPG